MLFLANSTAIINARVKTQQVSKISWHKVASPFCYPPFVRRVCWVGTFACGGRRTMRSALMQGYRYVTIVGTCPSSKVPLLWGIWTVI